MARTGSLHVDDREVLEPALRADEALDLLGHRPRVAVVHDEGPGRLIDDYFVRALRILEDLGLVIRVLDAVDQLVELLVFPVRSVAALRSGIGG